jgi:hypothetical protein
MDIVEPNGDQPVVVPVSKLGFVSRLSPFKGVKLAKNAIIKEKNHADATLLLLQPNLIPSSSINICRKPTSNGKSIVRIIIRRGQLFSVSKRLLRLCFIIAEFMLFSQGSLIFVFSK